MPLLWFSLAFLGGLITGDWLKWSWQVWLGLLILSVPLAFWLRRRPFFTLRPAVWIVAFLPSLWLGGALRWQLSQPDLTSQSIAWYNGRGLLAITGVVSEPPDVRSSFTYLRIQVSQVAPPSGAAAAGSPVAAVQPANGLLLAMALPGSDWQYGDRVTLTGSPALPPISGDFSFQDYLARQGIYSYLAFPQIHRLASGQGCSFWAWLYGFKAYALSVVYRIFPQPESALLAGILLGDASRLSPGLQQAYQATGTAHIIAISGFNIAILAGLFSVFFSRLLGLRWGAVAAAAAIIFYTLLVGANPSVVRAAIMGCLGLLAGQVGRRQAGLNSLALTAGVMCLFDPNLPWNVSFQLTFMATLGMVLYAQPFQDAFERFAARFIPAGLARRIAGPVGEYFLFSLAARVVALPVMVYHFRNLSLVAVLANPLVLPPQPLVEVLGGLALLGGLVNLGLGQALAWLAWPFVAYTNRAVEWLASIPHGLVTVGATSLWVWVVFYSLLFGLTFFRSRLGAVWGALRGWRTWLPRLVSPPAILAGGAVLAVLAWSAAYSAPDSRMHLTLLSGGAPGTLLIRTPGGRSVVVAGGPVSSQLSEDIGRRLPLFDRQVDLLLIATPIDKDLPSYSLALDDFPISKVVFVNQASSSNGSPGLANLTQALSQRSILQANAAAGQAIDLGQGASLSVVSLPAKGVVLLLTWNSFRALLPVGTVDDQGQTLAAAPAGPVSVLLLAGSGAPASNPADAITRLRPQLLLLDPDLTGCRANCPVVLSLPGYPLLRTDQSGWIEVTTDGKQMWVDVEKK